MRRQRELSGLSEDQARGGGSRPEPAIDESSFVGEPLTVARSSGFATGAGFIVGSSAADGDGAWHAGVQQSIFGCLTGMLGICLPSIAQPGIPLDGAPAAPAEVGARAKPKAQSKAMRSLVMLAIMSRSIFCSS